ncbi:MAG: DUF1015 family protein [Acidimicrobiales bacterium]
MPRLEPFRGLRYHPGAVRLDDVIAPPYDVIDSAQRARLAHRNPANAVAVELPEPDLGRRLDRYRVAATLLASWQARGILVADPVPSLYPYRMTRQDGTTSTGVIGALRLPGPDEPTAVLPHEQTLPKPKSDRLDLLRATRANLSPIWGLSLNEGVSAYFDPEGPPAAQAADDDGVLHQLWVLDDIDTIAAVGDAVGSSPVVIADGHHRYETALAYQREVRATAGDRPGPHDLVMALVVELADDQLQVGPIHRTLASIPPGTDLTAVFAKWFDILHAGAATERVVGALAESGALALVTANDAWLLTPRPEAYLQADSDLDSSLVGLVLDELPSVVATHRHTVTEAMTAIRGGEAEAAVLVRPPTVAQIAEWARAGRMMPPKSTYFTPKPRTGMVYRSLAD